jgi:hypothetical protein
VSDERIAREVVRLVAMHNFLTREDALATLEKGLP